MEYSCFTMLLVFTVQQSDSAIYIFFLFVFQISTMLCWFSPYSNAHQPQFYMHLCNYTCIHTCPPSLPSLPSPPLPSSLPSRWSQSSRLDSLCYTATFHQLSILHLIVYIYIDATFSIHPIFFPLEQKISVCMETQKTVKSQSNLEKEKQSWRNQPSWLQTILQSYSHQYSMELAQKQKYEPMNKMECPEIMPMHLWAPYTMEKWQPVQ